MVDFGFVTKQLVHYPPSVFSFYPPGEKERLLQTDLVLKRDNFALTLLSAPPANESWVDLHAWFGKYDVTGTPAQIADKMSELLMQAPLEARARARIIKFISDSGEPEIGNLKIALWLMLCSPDYQRN